MRAGSGAGGADRVSRATAGNAQVALTWTPCRGATSYNVKRSTTSGGPYANVADRRHRRPTFTNTGLTNGTPYYYVVTALNASGESPISTQVERDAAPAPGGDTGGVTVTKAVTQRQPLVQRDSRCGSPTPAPITAMTVTVVVQRTTGVSYSGAYNTVGGQITQSNASTTATVTYTWTLNAGQQLGAATLRTFAAQIGGNGTAHPATGDTWTVNYTTGGSGAHADGDFLGVNRGAGATVSPIGASPTEERVERRPLTNSRRYIHEDL